MRFAASLLGLGLLAVAAPSHGGADFVSAERAEKIGRYECRHARYEIILRLRDARWIIGDVKVNRRSIGPSQVRRMNRKLGHLATLDSYSISCSASGARMIISGIQDDAQRLPEDPRRIQEFQAVYLFEGSRLIE